MNTEPITIEKSFTVEGPARLSLENVDGTLDFQPGEAGVIHVTAVKHPGRTSDQTEIEMTQAANGRVTVATRFMVDIVRRMFGRSHREPARVDYIVRLPRNCELEVAYVSGAALVRGLEGEFGVRSVSGSVRLEDLDGTLRLNTVSGAVRGERLRLREALRLETVSGDVTLLEADLPAVKASTVSGCLDLQTPLRAGPYYFKSVSGDVLLSVPADTECRMEMHTLSGRVRTTLAADRRPASAGAAAPASAKGTKPLIHFRSVSGDLHVIAPELGQAEALPAEAETGRPEAPRTAERRLAVLERVERGELTVEDALGALAD